MTQQNREPQIGEKTQTRVGGNISALQLTGYSLAALLENGEQKERLQKNLRELVTGNKLSPLSVTFRDIAKDSSILDRMQPLDETPGMEGNVLMWDGVEGQKRESAPKWHLSTPRHRVLRRPNGTYLYQKLAGQVWKNELCFTLPPFFRRAEEEVMGSNVRAQVSQDRQGQTVIRRNESFTGWQR